MTLTTMLGSKASDAPERDDSAVSFIHLELRRRHKEQDRKEGDSQVQDSLKECVLS